MLQQIFSGSFNFYDVVAYLVAVLLIIFLILPFHEWAHAFVAYLLGDKEAKSRGRLTLNPISHIDMVGALAMIFVGSVGQSLYLSIPITLKNQSWVWRFALLQALWQIFLRHM